MSFRTCFETIHTIPLQFVDCNLDIPNLITGNSDGINDFFEIVTAIERPLELRIYNSWGNKVYDNRLYQNNWNGAEQLPGIYYYQITDPLLHKEYKGWLQVIH